MSTMISIIIPTKNEEKYLPKLLESLKQQTYQDFEVIVADATSADKTVEIAQKFGAKVVFGGLPAVGRNNGAKIARGEILFFLDSDVIFASNYLQDSVKEFNDKGLVLATSIIEPINSSFISRILHNFTNIFLKISKYLRPATPGHCIIVSKQIFEKAGGFAENVKVLEDLEFAARASKFGKFAVLKSVPIRTSDRRMKRDGWLITSARSFLLIIYSLIFGFSSKNLFNYQFKDY